MSSIVAVIVKIMPESPEVDLDSLKTKVQEALEAQGSQNISFEFQEIAFGLKAIMAKFAWPEEKETSIIEETLQALPLVSSVSIEDYRRAFG